MMNPITVNSGMIPAVQAGRKTTVRLPIDPQPYKVCYSGLLQDRAGKGKVLVTANRRDEFEETAPLFQPGSILYVQEEWRTISAWYGSNTGCEIEYKAGGTQQFDDVVALPAKEGEWSSPARMPCEAARIFLRVEKVWVERLQSITEEQAKAEGYEPYVESDSGYWEPATLGFIEDWNASIKPEKFALYGWDANPYVWVIEFERIKREEVRRIVSYQDLISCLRRSQVNSSDAAEAADLIETLLAEREAMLKDLYVYGSCSLCAHSCTYNNGETCKYRDRCNSGDNCWQWRIPKPATEDDDD